MARKPRTYCGDVYDGKRCLRGGRKRRYRGTGPPLCSMHYERARRNDGETRSSVEMDALRRKVQKERLRQWKEEMDQRYGKKERG